MVPAHEAIVCEHFARLDDNDPRASAELFAESSMNHGRQVTRAQVELVLRSLRQAAPDATTEVRELVSDGDVVVCRVTRKGTHLGTPELPFVDGGVFAVGPPTGRTFEQASIHWFRIRNKQIIEHWANRDDLGVARQLGLVEGFPSR